MKSTGPEKTLEDEFQRHFDKGISAYEYDFGADVFKEVFGDVDEPQTGLLWLANRVFDTSAAVISVITSCGARERIKPE